MKSGARQFRWTRTIPPVSIAVVIALASSCSHEAPAPSQTSTPSTAAPAGQIAFSNDPVPMGTHLQLFIESADGSNVRRLVTSNANDVTPSISPDGTQVMFTRQSDPAPDRIFVVKVDGSGLDQLIPEGCPSRCGNSADGRPWSADGSRIVFTREIFGSHATVSSIQLWTANADGTGARRITDPHGAQDQEASWSPDGTHLTFTRWVYGHPDRFEIYTCAADGTELRRLTPIGLDSSNPAWSPDGGSLIVFQSPPDPVEGQQIYTVRPDGSGLRSLTPHLGGLASNHPSWSPDGAMIVFAHAPSGPLGGDLFVMDRDGSDVHALAVTPLNENYPAWGPPQRS